MKMKKLTALISAVSVLGSAFTAIPLTAGAQESGTALYEQDFEQLGAQTLLEHKLDTEESVNSVKDGYTAMVEVAGTPSTFTRSDAGGGSMQMQDNVLNEEGGNRFSSAGLRYDITELVEGKSGKLTITADIRGGWGEVYENAGKIGFINDAQVAEADAGNTAGGFIYNYTGVTIGTTDSGDFTTISYTVDSVPEYSDALYFFISMGQPTMYVKNIKLTLEDESGADSRITPYTRFYEMSSSVISDAREGMSGNYLALTHSNNGTDPGQGAVIDLSGLGIENGDALDVSFDIATDSENLGKLQTFIKSAESVETLNTGFLQSEGATAQGGTNGWVARAGCGYENTYYSSASTKVEFSVDSVTIGENEKPYLCIMDANPTIYLDNIKVSEPSAPAETTPEATATATAAAPEGTPVTGDFVIADLTGVTDIYIDAAGADYDGISLVAEAFANDVLLVTGQTPDIVTDASSLGDTAIIAGTVNDANIKALVDAGKIDVSDITGKSEVYKSLYVEDPMDGVDKAIVIAGSDKRGTIYGIFRISELIGVSPWVYWGDALPEQQSGAALNADEINTTSEEPSVKYRGIFINDEAPNLTTWAYDNFGGYNHTFYQHVFELILRLKGNYLWPAMWSNEFNCEGIDGLSAEEAEGFDSLENARLADKYGVIMGTSHHEPMFRAGNEWGQTYRNYLTEEDAAKGSGATWDYFNYAYALDKFWEDGFTRNMDFEGVNTIGMRGEADSSLAGGLAQNVQNLENVITSQLNIMEEHGKSDMPTMLALYKEVEEYWSGGYEDTDGDGVEDWVPGLKEWRVDGESPLKDTIIMLCDDNFGNLRAVPQADEVDVPAGWGLYYHFDYNGAPISYRWVSSTPLEKIWENMTRAYEYKIDDLWIVNVGDIKPHEMEISYFLDLAYDYDKWSPENTVDDYAKQWTEQQFGYDGVSDELIDEIAELQLDYMKLNGTRRAEIVYSSTYSLTDANEINRYIALAEDIYNRAYDIYDKLPEGIKDAYYQMVLYQAAGSANVNLMNMYSALNGMYAANGSVYANKYAELVKECIERDAEMTEHYNKVMSGGKWDGIMQLTDDLGHYNCTDWTLGEWTEPSAQYVTPETDAQLIVNVSGSRNAAKNGGTAALPTFTSTNKEAYAITVSNGGKNKFDYTATASADWIQLSKTSGTIYSGDTIAVTIDWAKVTEDSTGTITITGADGSVTVNVTADVVDTTGLDDMTFVGRDGITGIEAAHYASSDNGSSAGWINVENYGSTVSTIKTKPFNADYTLDGNAPYVEYKVYAETAGDYTLRVYATPSNPTTTVGDVKFGLAVNGGNAQECSSLEDGFLAGDHGTRWGDGVLRNIHDEDFTVTLIAGTNTIRIYQLSSGFSLQKLALAAPGVEFGNAYTGPEESWYVGAPDAQKELVWSSVEDTMTIPGVIADQDKKVIVAVDGNYQIEAADGTALTADSVKLDGVSVDPILNPDGTLEATLSQGEYTIEYTGAAELEFTLLDDTPGVIINHPMSTNAEFSAAAAGYVNLKEGNDDKRVVSFEDGAMKYETTGLWNSSGFKYDISARVARAIEEYGTDTEFTLTMDIKGVEGDNARMGFLKNGEELVTVPLTGLNEDDFTTFTCKTIFEDAENIQFFVFTNQPTVYVKNISVKFPAPHPVELFVHDTAEEWAAYELYDPTNTEASMTKNDVMSVAFGNSHGFDGKNGIKVDVTELVKQCDNGGEFTAEVDFECWYWGGSLEIFLEDQDGNNRVSLAKATTDNENPPEGDRMVLSGSADYSYADNEKTYLCVTQHSGNHNYHSLSLTGTYTPGEDGDEPDIPSPSPTPDTDKNVLFTHEDAEDWEAYTLYDETNTVATVTKSDLIQVAYSGSETEEADKAHEWDDKNGIKIDITNVIKESGASRFGASADVLSWWWGEAAASISIEVVSDEGTETIALGAANGTEIGTAITVSGEADITLEDGEKAYLCIKHRSGTQQYDNISFWSLDGGEEPDPDTTPEPGPAPTPDTRVIVFSDDFADADDEKRYSAYTDDSLKTSTIQYGALAYTFNEGWSDININGMKADISDIVKNNGITTLNASVDITSYYWNDNAPKLGAEVYNENNELVNSYELATGPSALTDGERVTLSGSAAIEYGGTDTIYLTVKHPSGDHQYDNIMIWTDASQVEPSEGIEVIAPVLNEDGNGAYITVSNNSDSDTAITIYTASYAEDGTLASLALTPATVTAGAQNAKIDFAAAEGDTVYVWDSAMQPLTEKTVLEPSAWTAGWGSAQQEYMESDMPSTPLSGSVIRQVVRMSTGGDYMKLTLSNYYGDSDLVINSVHIADSLGSGMIDLATDTAVTFNGGSESVTIPKGKKVESDVIVFSADDLESIAMTIDCNTVPAKVTGHSGARTTTYIKSSATVSDVSMIGAETNEHWYFASEIDVLNDADYAVIACLGDSITDGRGCTTNANDRWTDVLMERIKAEGLKLTVVNDGIGGNSINNWGLGESGRDRWQKEVKYRSGVKYLIVLEGINDIGGKTEDVFTGDMSKCPEDGKITTGIIEAYQEIIDDAHAQGIKVIGGTILPCGNNDYYNETMEEMRQTINTWIRTEGNFDAVIDFDAVMRDPADHTKLKAEYDSGDGLHPGPAGYKAMGGCIDLALFKD